MMYEALVARIRYHIQKANFMGLKEAESTLLLGEAADAIEDLSKAQVQWIEQERKVLLQSIHRWIPVEEQLPDKPGIYAVWTAKGFGNHLSSSCFDGDSWSLRITHWMPLPEPPKEE